MKKSQLQRSSRIIVDASWKVQFETIKSIKSTYCYKADARVRRAEEISDINPNEDTQCSVKSEKLEKREKRICICVCVVKVKV